MRTCEDLRGPTRTGVKLFIWGSFRVRKGLYNCWCLTEPTSPHCITPSSPHRFCPTFLLDSLSDSLSDSTCSLSLSLRESGQPLSGSSPFGLPLFPLLPKVANSVVTKITQLFCVFGGFLASKQSDFRGYFGWPTRACKAGKGACAAGCRVGFCDVSSLRVPRCVRIFLLV